MKNKSSLVAALCLCAFSLAGCDYTLRQDMANQPRQNPLSPAPFFQDDRSERPAIDNTVMRGSVEQDALFIPKDSNAFPLPITQELIARGQDRYNIFCTPCHGIQGDGLGMVSLRGMKHPPTFHQQRLRDEPNGYYFDVMTNGFGAMNSYSMQITPHDRWAIVAYVRALQLSRNAHVTELPPNLREKLMAGGAAE
ncbi:MAG TPA: cytochrome c [Candidatus Acidoferrum sp.]|nr:cytochrome c [Candidatus Acidoferrum sp.]